MIYSTCKPLVWRYICSETGTALWASNLHYIQRVLLRVCWLWYTLNYVSWNCGTEMHLQFTRLMTSVQSLKTSSLHPSSNSLHHRCTDFSINVGASLEIQALGDTNQVPHPGPTIVRRHRTKFSCPGHLAHCISVPLVSEMVKYITSYRPPLLQRPGHQTGMW